MSAGRSRLEIGTYGDISTTARRPAPRGPRRASVTGTARPARSPPSGRPLRRPRPRCVRNWPGAALQPASARRSPLRARWPSWRRRGWRTSECAPIWPTVRRRLAIVEEKGLDKGGSGDHLLYFTRNDPPLSMNNVRRTLRKMLADAGLSHLEVSPHAFRRTSGIVIARATDAKTAAEVLGNTEEIAQRRYISPEGPVPHAAPAIHLQALAPRESRDGA